MKIQTSNFSAELGRNSGAADQRRDAQRHQQRAGARPATTSATRSSTRRTTSRRATPTATAPSRRSSSATSRARSAARSAATSCSSSSASSTGRSTASPTRRGRRSRRRPSWAATSPSACAAPTDRSAPPTTAILRDPTTGPAVPRQRDPAEPHHAERPRHRQHLPGDGRRRRRVHATRRPPTTRPTSSTTRSSRGRTSSASTSRRPRNQRIHGRYLHDEYNLIEPYGTFSGAPLPTVPTDRSRPGHQLPDRPHLRGPADADQRSEDRRRVERPAHQAAGRLLAARHVRLHLSRALRHARLRRRRHPQHHRCPASRTITGPSFALLSPTTDITCPGHADLGPRRPLDPQRLRRLAQPQGPERPRQLLRLDRLQRRRQPEQHRATRWPTRCSATSAPTTRRRRIRSASSGSPPTRAFVSDTWRVRANLSIEAGVRYEYSTPTYAQGNNLVNFDPSRYDPAQAVRVQTNGLLVPGIGNRFNGLVIAGDGIPEDQQGRVELLDERRLRAHSVRRAARPLRRAAPVHAARQLLLLAERGDGHPRRRRPVLRQAGRQRDLLAAEHPAGPRQRAVRELQHRGAGRAAPPARSARSATSTPSTRTCSCPRR